MTAGGRRGDIQEVERSGRILAGTILAFAALGGCTREARTLASDQPQTAPDGPRDPRIARYQDNVYQLSQGSRYFIWYGCSACHQPDAPAPRNLQDGRWRHGSAMNAVYGFIAHGHPGTQARYGDLIPTEILWQLSAYVRDLPQHDPARNRRGDMDARAEPRGAAWTGPLR